jgi:malate dehydrogenase (oxaloacetate-decarboxylating)(NADP+)
MKKDLKQEALDYHSQGRKGKIAVVPTKPYTSQRDLSLAYSPGVAEPCLAIAADKQMAYEYTAKGNLVAVISNGTAVLGLGDIGAEASKPVMEGKGLLFKIFADIDVFDIEVSATDPDEFVNTVKNIAPTFGGINLEDIKAPEAFEIERRLREELDIPVMHDDQHGTAMITGAALLNALELSGKKIEDVRIVVSGAGSSAVMCARMYVALGARIEHIVMCDSKGPIRSDRKHLDEHKAMFATPRNLSTLEEAMKDADVFLGLSRGNIVSKKMVQSMAQNCIVFALANPNPEITYEDAMSARKDIIVATGRSDYDNQVNNVLGFPYIFRGALDVQATAINEAMKLAAVRAIARLAKESVPEEVMAAYNRKNLSFGKSFIIPKPLDPRLLVTVAPAVAKAAMESGVARKPITDWDAYIKELQKRMGNDNKLLSHLNERARHSPQRVVFAESDNPKILRAAQIARDEGIAQPILLGKESKIKALLKEYDIHLGDAPIIDPRSTAGEEWVQAMAEDYYLKRQRKGVVLPEAIKAMRDRNHFGLGMLQMGLADAFISGLTRNYPDTIRPALQIVGKAPLHNIIAGMYILSTKQGPLFLADTTVNRQPSVQEIVDITLLTAEAVRNYNLIPKIALLSYSNFGSSKGEDVEKMQQALKILKAQQPKLIVDGEIQANFALNTAMTRENFPFSTLARHEVNTLIFPNLSAGNTAYKLVQSLTDFETVGPVLLGMNKSVHVLQMGSSVREIVNMIAIAAVDAQSKKKVKEPKKAKTNKV